MVDRSDITNMANLIAIMNGETPKVSEQTVSKAPDKASDNSGNIAAMKIILEQFAAGANSIAQNLTNETRSDGELREAMATQETDNGLIIGEWMINAKTDSGRKLYDVIRISEVNPIASDLTIYEAARGLARALHNGLPITSSEIRNLLRLEEDYANAVHNAIHSKHALKKHSLNEERRAIIEDKYSAAIRRANITKQQIIKLTKSL